MDVRTGGRSRPSLSTHRYTSATSVIADRLAARTRASNVSAREAKWGFAVTSTCSVFPEDVIVA
jgi:hypothetical protein